MDENNLQTLETNPGGEQNVPSAEGTQNVVANTNNTSALSLEEINAITRHNYSDLEQAKKGLENLVSFTGKKVEPQTPAELAEVQRQLKEMQFFDAHPELKEFRGFLAKFGDPETASKDPEVQKAIEAMKASGENNKSVLNTNSRIAAPQSSDYDADLAKAKASGDWATFLTKHKGVALPE